MCVCVSVSLCVCVCVRAYVCVCVLLVCEYFWMCESFFISYVDWCFQLQHCVLCMCVCVYVCVCMCVCIMKSTCVQYPDVKAPSSSPSL